MNADPLRRMLVAFDRREIGDYVKRQTGFRPRNYTGVGKAQILNVTLLIPMTSNRLD
jgi:hypothetical protein